MAYNSNQIDIGQSGGAWLDDAGVYVAPTGKVVAAINVVTAATFTTLTPANDVGNYYPAGAVTATAAGNGVNAEAIASGDSFPVGQWIYGRWSAVTLAGGSVILYFADA
jgi:glucose-6-phosphate isomerase